MTLFEKIITREIHADIIWENNEVIAFRDIHPQAPVHILVVPKKAISSICTAQECHSELLGKLFLTAARVAEMVGIAQGGFRLVINSGSNGGETVPHLHVHLLGGRPMAWPPG